MFIWQRKYKFFYLTGSGVLGVGGKLSTTRSAECDSVVMQPFNEIALCILRRLPLPFNSFNRPAARGLKFDEIMNRF